MTDDTIALGLLRLADEGGKHKLSPEEERVYIRLERANLIDVNIMSGEWFLTYGGLQELRRLEALLWRRRWRIPLALWALLKTFLVALLGGVATLFLNWLIS